MLDTTGRIIKHGTGPLDPAGEPGDVPKACQVMGYSRDTSHRYRSAVGEGGVEALFGRERGVSVLPPGVRPVWLRRGPAVSGPG